MPDRLINFDSHGFGGWASDFIMVEQSGYLTNLHSGACLMADRGFKNVSCYLHKKIKNCTFVRPPSVSAETRNTKEVKHSKQIATVCIHIEHLICYCAYTCRASYSLSMWIQNAMSSLLCK